MIFSNRTTNAGDSGFPSLQSAICIIPTCFKARLGEGVSIMPKQNVLKGGVILLGAVALAGANIAPANAQTKGTQSLLGVRLYDSYKVVLKKYGAPAEVRGGGEVSAPNSIAKPQNSLAGGGMAAMGGGGGGMSGMMGGGMAGMMGARSGGMGGGMPSGAGGGPPASMMAGIMAAQGAGRAASGGGSPFGAGGGVMNAGAPGGGKMGGMAALGSGGGTAGGAGANLAKGTTYGDRGGFLWVYLDPKLEKMTEFRFNKDGRLEGIVEQGRIGGSITSRGITLGSKIQDAYGAYGWPDKTEVGSNFLNLDYLQRNHLQLIAVKNASRNDITIVGLVIVLRENQKYHVAGAGGSGGGNPAMAGAGGGMGGRSFPGASGMSGGMGGRSFPGASGMSGGRGGRKGGGEE